MSEINPPETEKTIKAIQDIAITLTGAAEFVCEGRMLKRFSRNIEENLSIKERKNRVLIEQILLSIETREKKIGEKNKKGEEIRKKSFFQKLLRR